MKRLIIICSIALLGAPVALAGATKATITPSVPGPYTTNEALTFNVVIDRGSAAKVWVQCIAPDGGISSAFSDATPEFVAVPGTLTVSPPVTLALAAPYGSIAGSSCTAYLYDFVTKPNGSVQQMIDTTTVFLAS